MATIKNLEYFNNKALIKVRGKVRAFFVYKFNKANKMLKKMFLKKIRRIDFHKVFLTTAMLSILLNSFSPLIPVLIYKAYADEEVEQSTEKEEEKSESSDDSEESKNDEESNENDTDEDEANSEESEEENTTEGENNNENETEADSQEQEGDAAATTETSNENADTNAPTMGENTTPEETSSTTTTTTETGSVETSDTQPGDILDTGASDYRPVAEIENDEVVEVQDIPNETVDTETSTSEPEVTSPTYELLGEGVEITNSTKEDWNEINENTYETKEVVKVGVKYIFPLEEDVSVTFTKLPENVDLRSVLKIERVKVSDLDLPEDVTTEDEYAYDITTNMENGEFEYELTLPKPEGVEAEVVYIEKDLEDAKADLSDEDVKKVEVDKVEQEEDEGTLKVSDLDHFTIFVVVSPDDTLNDNSVVNKDNGWVSDNAYAEFNNSSDNATYGFPDLGIPSDASIEGIEVLVEGYTTGRDLDISIFNKSNSTPDGYTSTKTANLNGTESVITVGSPTEKWGKTWIVSDFDTDFKILVDANWTMSSSTAYLDQVQVKVYYSQPLTPPTLPNNSSDDYKLNSVTGVWTQTSGGSNVNGINTNEVRWGTVDSGDAQSGLRFDNSGVQTFNEENTFYLGMLTHLNWPIQNAATGATLKVKLDFDRPTVSSDPEFTFDFDINETSNSAGACPSWQESSTPCDDKITFPNSYGSQSFQIGDKLYTLKIEGFVDAYPSGSPISSFITEEQKNNSAFLVGSLSTILVAAPQISLVEKAINGDDADTASGVALNVGDDVNFTYVVQNTGNVSMDTIQVHDDQGVSVTCPKTTLVAGEGMTCTGSSVAVAGQYTNTAYVTSYYNSTQYTSNTESANYFGTLVIVDADLSITKDADKTDYVPGDEVTYTLVVTNNGPKPASSVVLTDNIPSGLTYLSAIASQGSCAQSAGGVTCNLGTINNGDSVTVTVKASVNSGADGTINNTGSVTSSTPDSNLNNNSANENINVQGKGTLIVKKILIKDNGGSKNYSEFSFSVNGGPSTSFDTDGQNEVSLNVGTYSVTEPTDNEYTTTYDNCTNVSVVAGGTATCTITNNDKAGTLIVKKIIDNKGLSGKTFGNFKFVVNEWDPIVFDTDGQNDINPVNAGTYTISEDSSTSTGYTVSYSNCSGVVLSNGETETCVITNTLDTGSLTIRKDAIPNSPDNFNVNISGPNNFSQDVSVSESSSVSKTLAAGRYTLTESDYSANYTTTINCGAKGSSSSGSISFDIAKGDNVSCTFTNTKKATIIVEKQTLPDGNTETFNFTGDLSGSIADGSQLSANVVPGTYTVTEASKVGWDLTGITCNDSGDAAHKSTGDLGSGKVTFRVEAGETVKCTFTNTKHGHLIVQKTTNPVGDLTQFNINITGGTVIGSRTASVTDALDYDYDVKPGTYTVSETVPSGWFKTDNCSGVTVGAGETKYCEIVNTKAGSITITKNTVSNNSSDNYQDFNFSSNFGAGGNFSLDGMASGDSTPKTKTFSGLAAGSYWVEEAVNADWLLTNLSCTGGQFVVTGQRVVINLTPGQNVNCTFENTKLASITGFKYNDINGNNSWDSGESKLGGWRIFIDADNDGLYDIGEKFSTTGPSNGSYILNRLVPGTYKVCEEMKTGWYSSMTGGVLCRTITLGPGDTKTNINFGNHQAVNIVASKVVCDKESDLPNWGASGGDHVTINSNTARDWVRGHSGCRIVDGWEFEWGQENTGNPGDTLVGRGGGNWNPFGPTSGGIASVSIPNVTGGRLEFREVLQNDYVPFSYGSDPSNGHNVSAEFYCSNDVENYDNWDFVNNPLYGTTYYCVGFNALNYGTLTVDKVTVPSGDQTQFGFNLNRVDKEQAGVQFSLSDMDTPYTNNTLQTGTYSLSESAPSGWVNSAWSCTKNRTVPVADNANIVVNPGDQISCTFTNTKLGSISGIKFIDYNGDSAYDNGSDWPSYGWTINLYKLQNVEDVLTYVLVNTTTTNVNGEYTFTGLSDGTYKVEEVQQTGYMSTLPSTGVYEGVVVSSGEDLVNYNFGNFLKGSVMGCKYNDINGNGIRSGKETWDGTFEPQLSGWTIRLYNSDWEKVGETVTNPYFYFNNVMTKGTYYLCEVMLQGWIQTEPGLVGNYGYTLVNNLSGDETEGKYCKQVDVTNSGFDESHYYGFGNRMVNPILTISKKNDTGGASLLAGDLVNFEIKVWVTDSKLSNVKIVDLLPEGFDFVEGTGGVYDEGNNLIGSISEPVYASPGTWQIGTLDTDEVYTIKYAAKVLNDVDSGTYKDLAWTEGTDLLDRDVLGQADSLGYVADNFVGTDLNISNDDQPKEVKADVDEEEEEIEEEGDVLGASTVNLPATGLNTMWLNLVLGLFAFGGLLLIFGGAGKMLGKKIKSFIILPMVLGLGILFSDNAYALSYINVRISEPQTPAIGKFNLNFVALDIKGRELTAACYVKSPSSSSFVPFEENIDISAGGNTYNCLVTDAILDENGDYKFKVVVDAEGGDTAESSEVSVYYDGEGPDKPKYIEKNKTGSCTYEIEFKTANDGETSYVEVYRDFDTEINVNDSTKIRTITIGPDEKDSFDQTLSGSECDDTPYYAVRAFDSAGNASDVRAEEVVTKITVEKEGKTTESTTEEVLGAIEVVGGAEIGGAATTEGATAEETTGPLVEEEVPEVLGEQTVKPASVAKTLFKSPLFWVVMVLALLLVSLGVYKKSQENEKRR